VSTSTETPAAPAPAEFSDDPAVALAEARYREALAQGDPQDVLAAQKARQAARDKAAATVRLRA
jgi:hypothetical protein